MSILFTEAKINNLSIPNRFVRSATSERQATDEGLITDGIVDLYGALADGGVGLIITGHFFIDPAGKANPGMAGVDEDAKLNGLKRLADRVHETESKIVVQISHAGRQVHSKVIGTEPVAPSPVYLKMTDETPREMTASEIESTIQSFIDGAKRVKAAGFDGVQLHAAHGYLISQFLSPYTNKRSDDWGGTPEKRRRFLIETVRGVRAAVGPEFPILIKLNADDGLPDGVKLAEAVDTVAVLEDAGVDAIEVSGGMYDSAPFSCQMKIDSPEKEAYFADNAREMKKNTKIPIILVGGMRRVETMERIIDSGIADFVSLCRPFIREPNLVNKFRDGGQKEASCISCNRCFRTRYTYCYQDHKESAPE